MAKGKTTRISADEFTSIYNQCDSLDDVAAHFGRDRKWAYGFAYRIGLLEEEEEEDDVPLLFRQFIGLLTYEVQQQDGEYAVRVIEDVNKVCSKLKIEV